MSELITVVKKALPKFQYISRDQWEAKSAPHKWSKKEILGHLIDSAVNNLQRFTEIQHQDTPYAVRPYNQDNLVVANGYQQRELQEVMDLWEAINRQIAFIIDQQTEKTLSLQILLPDGQKENLKFLMTDYVVHLKHHLGQIL